MQAARALLAAGRPVAETARATGFASVSHFGKTFCQHTGFAPNNERNQFESLFSAINTENTKDMSVHVKKVKKNWATQIGRASCRERV